MKTFYGLLPLRSIGFVFAVSADAASTSAEVSFGHLFFNGSIVRTVVVPSAFPNEGRDNFYKVTNGATGQLGIAAAAPGSGDYHGGAWKVFHETFKPGVTPVLLKSEEVVLAAQSGGFVTVTRVSAEDFRCPQQP